MQKDTILRHVILVLCALACCLPVAMARGADGDWESLFDGKTLDGWVQRNGKARYTVEDGAIVGTTVLDTPNSFLCTEKLYTALRAAGRCIAWTLWGR